MIIHHNSIINSIISSTSLMGKDFLNNHMASSNINIRRKMVSSSTTRNNHTVRVHTNPSLTISKMAGLSRIVGSKIKDHITLNRMAGSKITKANLVRSNHTSLNDHTNHNSRINHSNHTNHNRDHSGMEIESSGQM